MAVFATASPLNTLAAQSNPLLNVTPASVVLNYQVGTPPPVQSLNIVLTGAPLTYRVSTTAVSTPGTLVVGLNPSPIVGPGSPYPPPGSYTGSVIFTADGAANSPLSVPVRLIVTQADGQLSQMGGFAQIAIGGGWDTTITLINIGASPVATRVRFWDNNGAPLPLTVAAGISPPVTAPSFDQTISPDASTVLALQTQSASTVVGWAELDAQPAATIGGFALFRYRDSAASSEGTSPLTTSTSVTLVAPYDNVGYVSGLALANQSDSSPASLSLKILDSNGAILGTDSILLVPKGHVSFAIPRRYPITSGQRGIIEVSNQSNGVISGIGLRFSSTGSFTSLPTLLR